MPSLSFFPIKTTPQNKIIYSELKISSFVIYKKNEKKRDKSKLVNSTQMAMF